VRLSLEAHERGRFQRNVKSGAACFTFFLAGP
jgi:hypothetical protein